MRDALVGNSGFVGSTILRQKSFEMLYRSSNIREIEGQEFNIIVCAGAPAQKWIANSEPDSDRQKIERLIDSLKAVKCKTFVLISTVDVFKTPVGVDESSLVDEDGLHSYGLHRRLLERFVESHFANHLIVRLPGLVGPGLRKNIIFDFLNKNNLELIESRSVFQFYPMVNLWYDIQLALDMGLRIVHLTAEPVSVSQISKKGFGEVFDNVLQKDPVQYDMRSRYAELFGGAKGYQYSAKETIQAVRAYVQSALIDRECSEIP